MINLTQHAATHEQITAGVIDPGAEDRARVAQLLTFDSLPTREEIEDRASRLALVAAEIHAAATGGDPDPMGGTCIGARIMIGGAPYLMAPLERALTRWGMVPTYAFSRRESVEETGPDGGVRKTAVFRHVGFVE